MNDAAGPRRPTEPADGWVEVDLPFPGVRQFEEEFAPNLATDGLFIPTPEPLPPSTVVRFHVTLPDDFVLLEGTGIVVWSRPPGDPSGAPAGMSLRFATLSQHYQDLLDRIVQTHVERGGTPFEVEPRLGDVEGAVGDEPAPSASARGVASERPRLTVRRTGLPTTATPAEADDPSSVDTFEPTGPLDQTISLEPRNDPSPGPMEEPREPIVSDDRPEARWQEADHQTPPEAEGTQEDPDSFGQWPPWEPTADRDLPTAPPGPEPAAPPSRDPDGSGSELPVSGGERVYPDEVPREIPEELFSDDLDLEPERPEPEPEPAAEPPAPGDPVVGSADAAPTARRKWSMGRTIGTAAAAVIVIGIVAVLVLSPWSRLIGGEGPGDGESTESSPVGEDHEDVAPAAMVLPSDEDEDPRPDVAGEGANVPVAAPPVAPTPTVAPEPPAVRSPATRIEEIRWSDDGGSTTIRLRGDGPLLPERVALIPMSGPPRLLIRIRHIESRYEAYVIDVDSALVTAIRTGLHPELSPPALYVVADLTGDDVVVSERRFDGSLLEVTLGR